MVGWILKSSKWENSSEYIKIVAHMVGLVRYLNRHTHSLDSFGSFVGMVRSFDNKIVHSSFIRSILDGFLTCGVARIF